MQKLLHHISILNNKNDQIVSSDLKCREKEIPNRNMIMIIFYRTHIYYQRKGNFLLSKSHNLWWTATTQQSTNKKHIFLMNSKRGKEGKQWHGYWFYFCLFVAFHINDPCIYVIAFFIFKHYRVYFILFSFCILISFCLFFCVLCNL